MSGPERDDGAPWRNFYGRRHGKKLRKGQAGLVEGLLRDIEPPGLRWDENPERQPLDLAALYPDAREIWLEIGFGGGEHMLAQAQANPDVQIIGAEPFINGVAKLLAMIEQAGVTNLAVTDADARDVMDVLPSGSISRTFLLYPDPWPKTRHHKRRFMNPGQLAPMARVMAPGAQSARCDGYRGLCAAQPGSGGPRPQFRMAGRRSHRLAGSLARLAIHTLRGEGPARGPPPALLDFRESLTAFERHFLGTIHFDHMDADISADPFDHEPGANDVVFVAMRDRVRLVVGQPDAAAQDVAGFINEHHRHIEVLIFTIEEHRHVRRTGRNFDRFRGICQDCDGLCRGHTGQGQQRPTKHAFNIICSASKPT